MIASTRQEHCAADCRIDHSLRPRATTVAAMLATERAVGCPRFGRAQPDRPTRRSPVTKQYRTDWLVEECEHVETLTRFAHAGLDVRESRSA